MKVIAEWQTDNSLEVVMHPESNEDRSVIDKIVYISGASRPPPESFLIPDGGKPKIKLIYRVK